MLADGRGRAHTAVQAFRSPSVYRAAGHVARRQRKGGGGKDTDTEKAELVDEGVPTVDSVLSRKMAFV
jgi:hypothetical protein